MSKLQINFRSITPSPAVKYQIEKYFKKICKNYHRIQTCKVTIDVTKKKVDKIKSFTISIDITTPGKELITKKQNNNLYIAIRDVFYAAEKLLNKHCKRKQINFGKCDWFVRNNDDQSNLINLI